jgi:hypothetical protein
MWKISYKSPPSHPTFSSGDKLFGKLASIKNLSLTMASKKQVLGATNKREGGIQEGVVQVCFMLSKLYTKFHYH